MDIIATEKSDTPQRDAWFDNVKFVLIFLVVAGHMLEPLDYGPAYLLIYSFHIPLFVFVSGYFSRNFAKAGNERKLIERLVIPYIVFEVAYSVFDWWLFDRPKLTFSPFSPYWITWFLFSMVLWRASLPYVSRLRMALPISLLVGLAAGYSGSIGYFGSLSRTLVFMPFFLAGVVFKPRVLQDALRPPVRGAVFRILAVILLASAYAFFLTGDRDRLHQWFYGSFSYESMRIGGWLAAGYRLCEYAVACVLSASVLILVPSRKIPLLTASGRNTMYVFLLHGFVARLWLESKWFQQFDSISGKAMILGGALIITVILSSRAVRIVFHPLVEPRLDFLFKRGQDGPTKC
ncbi:MAG TPA: acyltransferase family protein [Myxococcota bacterium]|nr:acyltransferase family protein [Myxococcota bacterium]